MSTPYEHAEIHEAGAAEAPAGVQEQERIDAEDHEEVPQQNEEEEEQNFEQTLTSIGISVNDVIMDLSVLESDVAARIKQMQETLETIKSEIQKMRGG